MAICSHMQQSAGAIAEMIQLRVKKNFLCIPLSLLPGLKLKNQKQKYSRWNSRNCHVIFQLLCSKGSPRVVSSNLGDRVQMDSSIWKAIKDLHKCECSLRFSLRVQIPTSFGSILLIVWLIRCRRVYLQLHCVKRWCFVSLGTSGVGSNG